MANGVIYVGSEEHKLYAFAASSGKILWSASTGDVIESSPVVANGVVYVGSWDDKLYAFDASSGKTLWTASTGVPSTPHLRWPTASSTSVHVTTRSMRFTCLAQRPEEVCYNVEI